MSNYSLRSLKSFLKVWPLISHRSLMIELSIGMITNHWLGKFSLTRLCWRVDVWAGMALCAACSTGRRNVQAFEPTDIHRIAPDRLQCLRTGRWLVVWRSHQTLWICQMRTEWKGMERNGKRIEMERRTVLIAINSISLWKCFKKGEWAV